MCLSAGEEVDVLHLGAWEHRDLASRGWYDLCGSGEGAICVCVRECELESVCVFVFWRYF